MVFDNASRAGPTSRSPALLPAGWRALARVVAAALLALGLSAGGADAQFFGDSAGDPQRRQAELNLRIQQLEGQMRGLNGQIEQLNFQIRQLQDLVNRMQKDYDFRLQEIENGGAQPKRPPQKRTEAVPGADVEAAPVPPGGGRAPAGVAGVIAAAPVAPAPGQQRPGPGTPPQVFGQLPADEDPIGGVIGNGAAGPLDLGAPRPSGRPAPDPDFPPGVRTGPIAPQTAAAIPSVPPRYQNVQPVARPGDEYDAAYGYILNGEYELAETSFRTFLANHPTDRRVGSAQYWLGESFFARTMHREAADAYLKSYTQYPDGPKAPDSLLKLGLSLQGLGERKAACATYDELLAKYPKASRQLRDRAQAEKSRAKC